MSELFDPGLQPERTRLAWQRTGLAGLVVGLLVVRSVAPWAALIVGVVVAVVLWLATVKLRHADEILARTSSPILPGAPALVAVTLGTMLLGAVAFAAIW
ncbi:DUF202 domain-containing protein [Corynebacterium aurimucosum]|uniref:Putative membrane protein n=1 Tax=Corynebacterium aurimucosum (strain ATCC 700975 / DSM 44827 / CIP 107346 / CN-1) TaxID=548476 RepID=C3PJ87_CORA7|nr:DUF202 domain-containing protein [Corynebacterium aurimucosum]ACP31745.1 putative membrane protein [Corynebacterium aurimucosum ATCC 700975]QQU94036.1 DUF202 domain-containing protein [Corynebacterium aurimucosum]